MFIMSVFAKPLEEEWDQAEIAKSQLNKVPTNSPHKLSEGKLTGYASTTLSKGNIFNIIQTLFVNNAASIFNTRKNMEKGANLINDIFTRIGLEMHTGKGETAAKTKVMYIPGPQILQYSSPTRDPTRRTRLPLISRSQ